MSESSLTSLFEKMVANLVAEPMQISAHHDLPFAILCYPADQEIKNLLDEILRGAAKPQEGIGVWVSDFIVDEVGQYVARRENKVPNLQAVVQAFGKEGKNRGEKNEIASPARISVAAQEERREVVSSLDSTRILKETWKKLANTNELDWGGQAMHYWPGRGPNVTRENRSVAIAYGLDSKVETEETVT